MAVPSGSLKEQVVHSDWYKRLSIYEKPNLTKAIWQLIDTFVPFVALWIIMVRMVQMNLPYWQVLPLIVVTGGLTVRIFIIFHDCGHHSFFKSRKANRIVGAVCGILTFTPYEEWRMAHAEHHAGAGDLNRRGVGDIWTMTVEEYKAAPRIKQIWYRIYRNPFVLFVLGPLVMFLIAQRFYHKGHTPAQKRSVIITNLILAAIFALASVTIGLPTYLMIQLPVMLVAGGAGIWLFYVQHQYEGVYWARHNEWDPIAAALEGSSYYKLPKILQWFSGNIGLHHIHHLRPRIPNYNLQQCQDENPELQAAPELTLGSSLKSIFMNVLDEANGQLISFRAMKRRLQQQQQGLPN